MTRRTAALFALLLLPACARPVDDGAKASSQGANRAAGEQGESPQASAEGTEPTEEAKPAGPAEPAGPAPTLDARLTRFAASTNALGLDLYAKARVREAGNVAISPASIALAFDMLYAGAQGQTAAQMVETLHLEGEAARVHEDAAAILAHLNDAGRTSYELRVVNRLFGERSTAFEPAYLELTGSKYGAALEALDFRGAPELARAHINEWVSEQTRGRIEDLLPPGAITTGSRLVLTNAIYFLGSWQRPFNAERTSERDFTLAGGEVIQVPMMAESELYNYAKVEGADLVELPYTGNELSMLLVVPEALDGLAAVAERLSPALLAQWQAALHPERLDFALPRFELRSHAKLSRDLIELGMVDAFSGAADLTAISNPSDPAERLALSEAFHQVFVAVDEQGTEAAGATALALGYGSAAPLTKVHADHPFMCLIREHSSGALLFIGRVADPRQPNQ